MLQVGNVIVSFDVLKEEFLCDLSACRGACCIEGDAGAPLELDEQGVAYVDPEGDLVTSIVGGKDCVFTCYDEKGCCHCAIEKACREGKTDFLKPVSCHLYPIRVKDFGTFKGVNYNRWDVCKAAVLLGRKENLPVYKFLKEPLIRKFGAEWYEELEAAVGELERQGLL